jgi:alcohol dehydrogenase class IV
MKGSSKTVADWRRRLLADDADLLAGSPLVSWNLGFVGSHLADMGVRRVLVVVDQAAVAASDTGREIFRQIAGCQHEEFSDFEPNPRWQSGANAARVAADLDADAVLAVGGGSCCDVAKIAALGARSPALIDDLARGEPMRCARPIPIIAVPTTSGTGSEATHFAAIYVDGRKVSVAHPGLLPAVAVLDDRFQMTMPPQLAACSGLDALCQAMESLWAVDATPESIRYALAGGKLIAANIEASVLYADTAARRAMMVGSHLAGKAINISKTTTSHALSYQLTERFGLHHGHAVALTVGHLAAAIRETEDASCAHPLGAEHARERARMAASLLGVTPTQLPGRMSTLMATLGLPDTLRSAGVDREAIPELATGVDPVRLGNNPRRMSTHQLADLLYGAWGPMVPSRPVACVSKVASGDAPTSAPW